MQFKWGWFFFFFLTTSDFVIKIYWIHKINIYMLSQNFQLLGIDFKSWSSAMNSFYFGINGLFLAIGLFYFILFSTSWVNWQGKHPFLMFSVFCHRVIPVPTFDYFIFSYVSVVLSPFLFLIPSNFVLFLFSLFWCEKVYMFYCAFQGNSSLLFWVVCIPFVLAFILIMSPLIYFGFTVVWI